MSLEQHTRQLATELAAQNQQNAANLHQEYLRAQSHALELKAKLDSAHLAGNRLANFKVKVGPYYQCPQCWIFNGVQSALKSIPSGGSREDIFRCDVCGFDFSV